jgi:hypothetical protein
VTAAGTATAMRAAAADNGASRETLTLTVYQRRRWTWRYTRPRLPVQGQIGGPGDSVLFTAIVALGIPADLDENVECVGQRGDGEVLGGVAMVSAGVRTFLYGYKR